MLRNQLAAVGPHLAPPNSSSSSSNSQTVQQQQQQQSEHQQSGAVASSRALQVSYSELSSISDFILKSWLENIHHSIFNAQQAQQAQPGTSQAGVDIPESTAPVAPPPPDTDQNQ